MAIAVDSRQSGTNSAGASTLSWNHTLGVISNAILLVQTGCGLNTITSIQWDALGTPVGLAVKGKQASASVQSEIWFLLSPAVTGTKSIKITYGASVVCTSGSSSYSGVGQATPFNAASPQGATASTGTITVAVTSAVGELVVDSVVDPEFSVADTLVPSGSQTTIYNITNGGNNAGGASDQAGAASVTMSWTGVTGGGDWDTVAVSMIAAGGAALTGTAMSSITEADVVAGGKTIIITLTGDTWIPA